MWLLQFEYLWFVFLFLFASAACLPPSLPFPLALCPLFLSRNTKGKQSKQFCYNLKKKRNSNCSLNWVCNRLWNALCGSRSALNDLAIHHRPPTKRSKTIFRQQSRTSKFYWKLKITFLFYCWHCFAFIAFALPRIHPISKATVIIFVFIK